MKVAEFLRAKKVAYEFIPHPRTTDAQRLAHSVHAPGREVAKTVLLHAGAAYVVAVLPADRNIDLDLAKEVLGASKVELATELDIAKHCPDCELGALPPFGSQYRMKTLVEESLTEDEQIVFEGNNHHEAYRISFADFQRLEQPIVAAFAAAV